MATTWTFDPPAGKAIAITTPATTPRPNLVCLRRHHDRSALARAFAAYASAEATFSWSSISHPLVDHIILAPRCWCNHRLAAGPDLVTTAKAPDALPPVGAGPATATGVGCHWG
ncbi:MAG: hypothetical protein M0013_06460 [Actinomycetota bacterium]|nr:hypothetical protein [Actinomycetota bacterium]